MSTPTGNDLIREAMALMARRLIERGYRFTKTEADVVLRAEAALGGSEARLREVRDE